MPETHAGTPCALGFDVRIRVHPLIVLAAAFAMLMCDGNDDTGVSEDTSNQSAGQACVEDSQCGFPESRCEGSLKLVFFADPRCERGRCVSSRRETSCPCANGGCNFTTTTGASPGIGGNLGAGGNGSGGIDSADSADSAGSAGGGGLDGSPGCPPGVIWPCECPDGGASTKQCGPDGTFGECACPSECTEQDLSRCTLPPSQCIDSGRMRYFTNPSCVDGRCAWKENTFVCRCVGGACLSTTTAGGSSP